VFFVIFVLLYMIFHSATKAMVLIFPTFYAMTGGLILQRLLGYNLNVAVWGGLYRAILALRLRRASSWSSTFMKLSTSGHQLTKAEIEAAAMEGALQRLRPKLITVTAVLASLIPILLESGIGSDVMRPIAAPIVGGMITSTIHVLILVPVFFVLMKEGALRRGTLRKEQLKQ
jgi:Cu(I)/Ag(I) efflux system membrane protein CusA/SilA